MLVVSCNTQAIMMSLRMREQLGQDAFVDGLQRLGFAVYTDQRPPPPTTSGTPATRAWVRRMSPPVNRVKVKKRWDPFEWAQMSIGQGPVDVTLIGVSRFVSAIGNGGVMLPVTLEADRLRDVPEGRRVMKPETAPKLMQAMLEVVQRGDRRARPPHPRGDGVDVGGKTGTADVRRGHVPDGWFAGLMFTPDGRPRYSVVVYLQNGGQGGRSAAPVAAMMTRWMAQQAAAEARRRRRPPRTRAGRNGGSPRPPAGEGADGARDLFRRRAAAAAARGRAGGRGDPRQAAQHPGRGEPGTRAARRRSGGGCWSPWPSTCSPTSR